MATVVEKVEDEVVDEDIDEVGDEVLPKGRASLMKIQ